MRNSKLVIGIFIISCLVFCGSVRALDDPEAAVAKVIEDYVIAFNPEWVQADIQISFKFADKIFESLKDLSNDANFKVVDVYRDFRPVGNVIFPLQVSDGTITKKIFLRAQVRVLKSVVVAKESIRRGQVIEEAGLTTALRDIAMLPQKYFSHLIEVIGKESTTSIPKNSTIFNWMVKAVPLLHRGDEVFILLRAKNLLVRAPGIILSDGYLDKNVKVKKKGSTDPKNILEGKLISSDEVEVRI
jgi:flagella basal body P-ring formation protein FlgA